MPCNRECTQPLRFLIHPFVVLFDAAYSKVSSAAISFYIIEIHRAFDSQDDSIQDPVAER